MFVAHFWNYFMREIFDIHVWNLLYWITPSIIFRDTFLQIKLRNKYLISRLGICLSVSFQTLFFVTHSSKLSRYKYLISRFEICFPELFQTLFFVTHFSKLSHDTNIWYPDLESAYLSHSKHYFHYLLPKACCGVYTALEDRVKNNALLGHSDWIYVCQVVPSLGWPWMVLLN